MATHLNLKCEDSDGFPDANQQQEWSAFGNLALDVTAEEIFPEYRELKRKGMAAARPKFAQRLLVVDDQERNLQSVGSVLGGLGYQILPATSGAQAMERMATCLPDLVLIDLLRPDMDGLKLCRLIRGNPDWAAVPVMIYSLAGDRGLTARAFESGAVDCVTNVFNHAELISRVRAQLSHKTARDLLQRLTDDKEESIDMLMHDLKNHLVGMHMGADVLCDGDRLPDDPQLKLMLETISRSSSQMLSIVNQFLANAATGHHPLINLEPVSFAEAASHSVQRFQEAARRKELVVHASLPGDCTLVQADPRALNQVLDNLLSNAVKFSPPGKEISVVVLAADGYVECQIQDQGHGFTPDDKQRMFRRYEQLSARPTAGEPCAGLGLSIVKKLTEAMRGELSCESNLGRGARFSVRLPRPAAQF